MSDIQTICYDVTISENGNYFYLWERDDIYTKPQGFFKRLSQPVKAELQHRQLQRSWLNSDDTYRFEYGDNVVIYARFLFEHNETIRQIFIENIPTKVKVNCNE